jgi:hypothetical protein
MRYSADDLKAAGKAGLITPEQVETLLVFFAGRMPAAETAAPAPKFDIVHLLWYAGALIVMSAMGLFSTLAFSAMGGTALTVTAVIYAVLFLLAGHYLWTKKNLRTPGGLLIAVAVSMAPLAVYGVQDALGLWSTFGKPGAVRDFYVWIRGSWVFMELAAIAAAALALRFYRFPFLVLIIAIALWFLSMDIVPWITGAKTGNYETARKVSIAFGLAMLAIAAFINTVQRSGDFAFWLYLFGMMAFWGGVTATANGTALDKALYGLMNAGLLVLAIFLGRRVFAVFGTIGITIYLGDLASKVFKDAILFPFALSLIGVAIIALGLYVHRRQHAISAWFDASLPDWLRRLRPANATGI